MTEAITSFKPILAVLCPLMAAPAILLLRQRPNMREGATLIAAVVQFAIIVSMAPTIVGGDRILFRIIDIGAGIEVGYRIDAFGLMFAITSSFLWILVSLYSI